VIPTIPVELSGGLPLWSAQFPMPTSHPKPPAHPGAAVLAIGGMSLVLAVVLELLGFSRKLDALVSIWISNSGLGGEFRGLPVYAIWVWTVPLAFGLAAGMLGSRLNWRRSVLWVTTLFLTLGWIPVLALAGYKAAVTTPLLALVWCGLWSMIYATRHQEPGERTD
jgi:hypothetical protein